MGLLSNPSLTVKNKLGRKLAKHSCKICFFFYITGIIWFVCLAHSDFNHATYLSENALSPGLVYPEMKQDSARLAQTLLEELRRECGNHKSTVPYTWLSAKMKQIGLETFVHNFTLRYPFADGKEYHGINVYGILRASKIGSTEGLVFSASYRPSSSVHADISPSIPVLLAFADFARRKNYWSKDLIFLVTEQEQLGMHAWLEAYHGGENHDSSILNCGKLVGRAGALQAALNLEIHDLDIDYIDIKMEGLNGQLPNLDMFNLVQRITSREGISSGHKQTLREKRRSVQPSIEHNLKHMLSMLASQALGVPNGNHGIFHRYRIESLTLEAVNENGKNRKKVPALSLLKTLEGISRSLNNLLERFHQSYFFYILVQNDRFVSIGDYMPCLILLSGPLFIKAFLQWLTIDCREENQTKEEDIAKSTSQLPYNEVLRYLALTLSLGLLCNLLPSNIYLRTYSAALNIDTSTIVSGIIIALIVIAAILPAIIVLPLGGLELLHIATLILLGVALIVVGLLTFALGLLLAIFCVPLAIFINTDFKKSTSNRTFQIAYTIGANPLVSIYLVVVVLTLLQFPELALCDMLLRALSATKDVITFAFMDHLIYGNWLYTIIATGFFPIWTLFWTLALSFRPTPTPVHYKDKTN